MGKNKKRSKVMKKKLKPAREGTNPFEMRINKQKHSILGRKTKNDRGMPGISRNKAIKKRKETLLQEYKLKNKSNSYVDRRFGANDDDNLEDKAAIRFAIERKKTKINMYNLNDDEELTHLGRSIGDMDKFDDPGSDSEEEERLEGDVVKKAHFGGGILTKKDKEESEKSHKAIMEEIIADRIKRKHERQKVKEDNMDLTDKLDGSWKDIQKLMVNLKQSKAKDDNDEKPTQDDYDIKVKELKFEAKGKATDKLKTAEEIAYEERQKLERLEMERLERMNGESSKPKSKHISADGLEDDFQFDDDKEDKKEEFIPSKRLKDPTLDDSGDDNEDEKSEDEGKDDETSEDEAVDDGNLENENDEKLESEDDEKSDNEDTKDEDGNDNSEDDSDDSYADVLTDDEVEKQDETKHDKSNVKIAISNKDLPKSIPFVIECPTTFEEFFKFVSNRTHVEISTIIERIIKCNHPSLSAENKGKLENLFAFILQFIDEICTSKQIELKVIDTLTINCKNLMEMSPKATSKLLLSVINEKRDDFLQQSSKRNNKTFPGLSTLIYLKLVSILYPTSDFRHPIVTPAMVFMSEIISLSKIHSLIDISRNLFVCSLFYEYVSVSKRLVPEVVNFLNKIVNFYTKKDNFVKLNVDNFDYDNLKPNNGKFSIQMLESELENPEENLIGQILTMTLGLISKFATLYKAMPSYTELFDSTVKSLSLISVIHFQEDISSLISKLSETSTKSFVKRENRRPPALKLYEPRIQENFDGKKKHHGSQKKLEQQKLIHKHKREMKGAMREIRRDNHFIASEKLNEQLSKDQQRKEKLKRLYQDLASQEGEFKKLKKKK